MSMEPYTKQITPSVVRRALRKRREWLAQKSAHLYGVHGPNNYAAEEMAVIDWLMELPEVKKRDRAGRRCVDCGHVERDHSDKYESEEPGEYKYACTHDDCGCTGFATMASQREE